MGAIIRLDERHARAYVAEPEGSVRGRVLVVHDAYGLLPHVRLLCDDLARRGFVALAPDLFAGAATRSDAGASRLLEALTPLRAARVLGAAMRAYETLGHTDGPDAAVGFSVDAEFAFGLVAARRVQTTVTYYGLPSDEHRDGIGGALLAHWAERDRWDDDMSPQRLVADLRGRGVEVISTTYPGTVHGFGNADIEAFDEPSATRVAAHRAVPVRPAGGRLDRRPRPARLRHHGAPRSIDVRRPDVTTSRALFELKVIVEADGWRDVSTLVDAVDRALEPHRRGRDHGRRWSVVASPLPAERAGELLWFIEGCEEPDDGPDQLTA